MSTNKLQRWIDLLAALLIRDYPVSFAELAKEVPGYGGDQSDETRRRMFERDKDELRKFGIPIETRPGEDGDSAMYQLRRKNFYLPYLVAHAAEGVRRPVRPDVRGYASLPTIALDSEQLAAIADAAGRVRQLGDPTLAADAVAAMKKLAWDLSLDASAPDDTRLVPPRAGASPDTLTELDDALARRKRVTFTYGAMSSDRSSSRTVEPYGLFFLNQHWYLAARDESAQDGTVKNYRLNRMEQPVVNQVKPQTPDYAIPESFSLQAHARSRQSWELGDGDAVTAIVAVRSASGAAIAAAALGRAIPGQADQREFRVRRRDSFARWLLSFAGELTPVAPPDIVSDFRALVLATLAHHRRLPDAGVAS